jgi:hypothetical protein
MGQQTMSDQTPEPDNTTTGEAGYAVYRDGRQQSPSGLTYMEAVGWLHRAQGQSVAWATQYEGWAIEEQPYCQAHDIYDCPFPHE